MKPISRDIVLQHVKEVLDISPQYLWTKYPNFAVLRHGQSGKWFALVMDLLPERLGLSGDEPLDVIVVKCDPRMVGSLLETPGYRLAYHMNKKNWITVLLDGTVSIEDIYGLLELGYDLTRKKAKHKAAE